MLRGRKEIMRLISNRFSALHSGLGMKEEGLEIFISQYIEELLKSESEIVWALLQTYLEKCKPKAKLEEESELSNLKIKEYNDNEEEIPAEEVQLNFVEAVRRLYEYVAAIIEEKHDFIEKYFGTKGLEAVIKTVQTKIDQQICNIYRSFLDTFQFTDIVRIFQLF
jgi:hypothetical protein